MIECKLCSKSVHSIALHLKKEHDGITVDDYEERFPGSPLLSEAARAKIEAKKKAVGEAKKEEPKKTAVAAAVEENTGKVPLHELFNLGSIKAARTAKGNPIPITTLEMPEKEPELVPVFDTDYVFDVDVLKSCLMGIELSIPTYIWGHAGVGKSTFWENIAAATNRRLRRVQHTPNTEECHIVGQYVVKHIEDPKTGELKAKTEFELGDLPIAMLNGDIYMADEYDRAYPNVLSVYQAVLEGKALHIKEAPPELRYIRPHPNFRFVATGNTNGSGDETGLYQATVVQDAATFERFGIVEKIEYMPAKKETAIVMRKTGLVESDAKKIVDFAAKIRQSYPTEVSLTLGPRVLINIAKIGLLRGDFVKGVMVSYSNRLPEAEAQAALSIAQRTLS
ncbi:putative porphyrin biosynthetic protein [Vibrio coralliirubri]|uniref:AAA family ATPase n=1 Tax=Vibrio coralliirubri TaxID=1516159 RepID=UPI000637CD4D|nr:MoxR family ATPase [Vibrio coralliirubri]CDT53745.1 putative porphyrin biosynthetic protein [Vibrio coralliirubri]